MADLIPYPREAPIAILDVGAGYGALTRVMLDSCPPARVVAHDYSREMLASARGLLAPYGKRAAFLEADLFSEEWLREAEGPFEAVVSSIAIHNLQSAPRVRQLYREIFGLLDGGGCFLNIDLISAPGPALQRIYRGLPLGQPPGEVADGAPSHTQRGGAARNESPPFPATLEEQLAWLRDAGFPVVDCFWKELGRALVGGYK